MSKYVKKGIYFLFLGVLSIQLGGCEDGGTVDPNSQQQVIKLLTGNVISFWGEPKANIKVSTDSATVYTDAQGNFSIPDVAVPYNLYISDSAKNKFYLLKETSADEIKFVFENSSEQYTNTCELKVIIPQNIFGTFRFVFTDGKNLNAFGIVNYNNNQTIRLNGYNSVTGKLCVIGYTTVNNKIVSYENFGYKDVTLTSGGQFTVNFDSTELAYNPDETTISGTFTNFSSSNNLFKTFSFSFGEEYTPNYTSQISFEPSTTTPDFNYVVPVNLPVFFKPMVYMQTTDNQNPTRKYRLSVDPGTTGGVYEMASPSNLISPPDGGNISMNTQFEYGSNKTGIYVLRIYDGTKTYFICTDKMTTTLECLSAFGLSLHPGITYNWAVNITGPYTSINEFAENPISLTQFNSNSEGRIFTAQ